MATLVLRTVKGSPLTNLEVDGNFSNINTEVGIVNSNVGVLSNLTTTANTNLVAAINEIASESTTNVTITGGNISGVTLSFLTSDDTTTNSTFFPTFQTASTGNAAVKISSSKLTFNPSSGLLSSTDYNSSSDISLKQDFVPINNSLDIISKLNGFGFTWKDSKEKSYGLSAQEVEQVIPEIVRTRSDGFKGINYMNLTAFLIEAIKDLKLEIQELKKHK